MLGSCPNKNSDEWNEIFAMAGENEELAMELWRDYIPPGRTVPYGQDEDLNSEKEIDENSLEYIEIEDTDPESFTEAIKKVMIWLRQKRIELSNKKLANQEQKKEALKKLEDTINKLEGAESINAFVEDAYIRAKGAAKQLDRVMRNYRNEEQTAESKKKLLDDLVQINDFATGFSILDEISKVDIDKYFSNPTPNLPESKKSPRQKLSEAIAIRDALKRDFVQNAIPLMAEVLVNVRSYKGNRSILENIRFYENKIESIQNSSVSEAKKEKDIAYETKELNKWKELLLDKDKMIELLTITSKDESFLDSWVSPLISSKDSALSLFAKLVKSSYEEARMQDIAEKDEAIEFLKTFQAETGRSFQNVANFNKGIYEEILIVKKDKDGKTVRDPQTNEVVFDKTMAFVQKIDFNAYKKAKYEFLTQNPKPKLAEDATADEKAIYSQKLKEFYKKLNVWYSNNTKPKSTKEIQQIKADKYLFVKLGILTEKDYEEWLDTVEYTNTRTGVKSFKGILAEPSAKYLNPAWEKLYNEEGDPISSAGRYHKKLTDLYFAGQALLPEAKRNGYMLPSIEMSDWERTARRGVVNAAKVGITDSFKIKSYDQEVYGVGNLSEQSVQMLPVYYTQMMTSDDISVDLLSSVLRFNSMARRYDASNKLQSEISAFKSIIGDRKIAKLSKKGDVLLNKTAKQLGYEKEMLISNDPSRSEFHLKGFLDMVVYGESQKAEQLMGLEVSKIANTLMGIAAKTTLSLDFLKSMANNIQGNIQVLIESAGGEFFNKSNLAKANLKYWSTVNGSLADFGRLTPESWQGQLVERYDPIQGNFKDEYGRDVSVGVANKLMRSNTIFFMQHFGEHEVQVKTMFALMDATKVIDKETNEEITLLEAHEKYGPDLYEVTKNPNGTKSYSYKVEIDVYKPDGTIVRKNFEEKDRQDFMNTLHALNKRMHGVYNEFDKGVIQRHSGGRLLMMYRKHIVPGYTRRYSNIYYDDELGSSVEGIYRTFHKTLIRDLFVYRKNIIKEWSTYTPFQKSQIRKVLGEVSIIMTLLTMIGTLMLMAGDDDDEESIDKTYLYNFINYQAKRMRSETMSYLPVIGAIDIYRLVKSPSAATSTVDRSIKLLDQIMPWNITEEYERKEGPWEKGDSKAYAAFLRVMGYTGNNFNPAEAVKSFESSFFK
jgi:hypothetical protein